MNFQHVNVKIPVEGELAVDLTRFIELFHRWIAEKSIDELLIDVADYRHVPRGPGVMLIGLKSDYAMDHTGGTYGLAYNRKAPLEGTNADRFGHSLRSAAKACLMLESELEGLRFSRDTFAVCVNDRALAPNNAETRQAFEAELSAFLSDVLGQNDCTLDTAEDPRLRVGAVVHLTTPLDLESLSAG